MLQYMQCKVTVLAQCLSKPIVAWEQHHQLDKMVFREIHNGGSILTAEIVVGQCASKFVPVDEVDRETKAGRLDEVVIQRFVETVLCQLAQSVDLVCEAKDEDAKMKNGLRYVATGLHLMVVAAVLEIFNHGAGSVVISAVDVEIMIAILDLVSCQYFPRRCFGLLNLTAARICRATLSPALAVKRVFAMLQRFCLLESVIKTGLRVLLMLRNFRVKAAFIRG